MLDRTFNAVFDGLNEQYKPELEAVRVQYPLQDLRYRCPCLRFKYAEAMALLREQGPPKLRARLDGMTDESAKKKLEARIESVANHADTEDIGTEDEKLLGEIIGELYGQAATTMVTRHDAHVQRLQGAARIAFQPSSAVVRE